MLPTPTNDHSGQKTRKPSFSRIVRQTQAQRDSAWLVICVSSNARLFRSFLLVLSFFLFFLPFFFWSCITHRVPRFVRSRAYERKQRKEGSRLSAMFRHRSVDVQSSKCFCGRERTIACMLEPFVNLLRGRAT